MAAMDRVDGMDCMDRMDRMDRMDGVDFKIIFIDKKQVFVLDILKKKTMPEEAT